MGKQEIRYAAKVSLDTPPEEQKLLHVGITPPVLATNLTLTPHRIDGIQMVELFLHRPIPCFVTDPLQYPSQEPLKTAKSSRLSVLIGLVDRLVIMTRLVIPPQRHATKVDCTTDYPTPQSDDVRDVDLTKIHYLTGPFEIETAEPGDVLVVEIQDVQPLQEQPWGFTGIFSKENGGGFLDEIYPKPYVFL